ncbi:MAG TPA: hypothetical protein VGO70_03580 [Arsenicitalea sp.]|nr:hypothetical protein [Arsenicitalea sp.]
MDDKVTVRLSPDMRRAIERLQGDHPALLDSTEAACRHIIADWLQSHAYLAGPRAVADGDAPGETFVAEETANRIAQRIRASRVEQLPEKDVEGTAARDHRPPAAGEVEALFAPVWDSRRQFTPFNRCFFDASFSRPTSESLAFEAPTAAALDLDCLLLTKSIAALHRMMKTRRGAMLLVPVDFRAVFDGSAAVRYVRMLQTMPQVYKAHLMLEVCGLPNNYGPDRILKLTGLLQRYVQHVAVELSVGDPRLAAVARLGAWAISLDLSGLGAGSPRLTAQLKQFAAACTAAQVSTIARGASSIGLAISAADANVTYIEGTSIHLPVKEPRPPLRLRPLQQT